MSIAIVLLAACGQPNAVYAPGPEVQDKVSGSEGAPLSSLKMTDLEGEYTVNTIILDSDPAKDVKKTVTLTPTLETKQISTYGVQSKIIARLGESYLLIQSDQGFSFNFSFLGGDGKLIQVGPYSAGSISGQVILGLGKLLGFDGIGSTALLHHSIGGYIAEFDGKILTLTMEKDTLPGFLTIRAEKK